MIPDMPVLLLLLAAGACLVAGIPGLLNPAWAADHYWQLALVGASLPLLALVPVAVADERAERRSQRQARDAATAERLARLDASLSNQEALQGALSPEKDKDADELERAWKLALDRFFRAGEAAGGFSIRKLGGVVGSDTWGALVHFYGGAAGGNILRDGGGDTGYTWGHGWTFERVSLALHTGQLPHPDMPVPVVQLYVNNTTRQNTRRRAATAPVEPERA